MIVVGVLTIGQRQLIDVVVVVMAQPELGHDVVELVLAENSEDLEVALRMFRKTAGQQAAGRATGREMLLEVSHGLALLAG